MEWAGVIIVIGVCVYALLAYLSTRDGESNEFDEGE